MYARRPQAANSVTDPIGLAAELLRPESIARACVPLDRATLRALAGHDWSSSIRITNRLRELGLVGIDAAAQPAVIALPEVDAALQDALTTANVDWNEFAHDAAAPGTHEPGGEPDHTAGVWFTPALTTTGEVAECLRMLRTSGLRLNRSGSVGVAAVRELAARAAITPEAVTLALRLLSQADLTVTASHQLVASASAGAWLDQTHQARWLSLARSFLATLPSTLRELLAPGPSSGSGDHDRAVTSSQLGRACAELTTHYPLLTAIEVSAAEQFLSDAELLGCTAHGQFTPLALRLLTGAPVTVADVAEQLPPAATGVYLQPDLTVLSPGPLDPVSEAELASLTSPEQIGPATMRRISEATIAAAFERGVSPAQARATFERLSLTGIPQPLAYLLQSVTEHVGRIVVHEHTGGEGRSRIRVAQTALAETVMVDRQLQHLQLTRASATQTHPARTAATAQSVAPPADAAVVLYSRLRPDHVITAFNEARYHASLAGSETTQAQASVRTAASTPAADTGVATATAASTTDFAASSDTTPDQAATSDPYAALIERVIAAARTEPAAATFTRKLELAIRDKTPVLVTAESRGQRRTFTLLPVSLTDGRLRAADEQAAVERTLPVSMIVSVEPA